MFAASELPAPGGAPAPPPEPETPVEQAGVPERVLPAYCFSTVALVGFAMKWSARADSQSKVPKAFDVFLEGLLETFVKPQCPMSVTVFAKPYISDVGGPSTGSEAVVIQFSPLGIVESICATGPNTARVKKLAAALGGCCSLRDVSRQLHSFDLAVFRQWMLEVAQIIEATFW